MKCQTAVRLSLLALVGGLAACAGTKPPRPPEPARVSIEILRGAKPGPAPASRVAIVIDASASMRASAAPGATRLAAAQTRATEVLESLPPGTRISVDVAGSADGACGSPVRLVPPSANAGIAAAAVARLAAAGKGSLAEALQASARGLAAEGAADGARVVAFTDLEEDCGGDLCAAVNDVVATGASLDLVVVGNRPTPACVATSSAGPPIRPGSAEPPAPTRFDVLPVAGGVVAGVAGASPVQVPAGAARIQVALEPPLEIGPLSLSPGALVRVRVLDFPAANPPVREWSIEVVGGGADLAASSAAAAFGGP